MAYVLPNNKVQFPPQGSRYVHRRVKLTLDGSGAASAQVAIPCPGRLIAVQYAAAAHAAALTVKADSTAGVQIWTDADVSSTSADGVPTPLGTTAKDEGNAATAATDGFSGGFPVRTGAFVSVASGTAADTFEIDLFFRLCAYTALSLSSQSGADGAGVVTRYVDFHGAGVLAAIAIDYQNMPATTDLIIKADGTSGWTLFTNANTATDLAPTLLGRPAADEAINVGAATDGTECGNAFRRGLFFDVAQADAFTTGNEVIVIECWVDM